jgi:hypothetical protein
VRGEILKLQDFLIPGGMALTLAMMSLLIQRWLLAQERIVFGRS